MPNLYNCIYCKSPCTIEKVGSKEYMNCPKCGKKEATKLLIERLKLNQVKYGG